MNKNNLFKALTTSAFVAMAFVSLSVNAATINVNYQVSTSNYESLSGSFSGDDNNNNGLLEFSELSAWYTGYDGGATLAALNDIGDFNYNTNTWIPNAEWAPSYPQDAYMTWNNWGYTMSTSNVNWAITTTINTPTVPVPAAAWLLGSGLLGLIGVARRKAA